MGFCVDSIKSNAKTKKEERSGKVGTVEKADLKLISKSLALLQTVR